MSKSFIVLAIVALTCVSALHLQSFAPSKPGGTYYGANGTQSTPTPNYNTQPNNYYNPQPNNYYNNYNTQPNPNMNNPYYNNNGYQNSTQSTTNILVNGQPYVYTGPFRLVCYQQNSSIIYRQDTCNNASVCATLLNDYRNCIGTVKKFAL